MKIPREKLISIKMMTYTKTPLTGHFAVVKNYTVHSFSEVSKHTLASASSEGLDKDPQVHMQPPSLAEAICHRNLKRYDSLLCHHPSQES